jgi:hypothetical protein
MMMSCHVHALHGNSLYSKTVPDWPEHGCAGNGAEVASAEILTLSRTAVPVLDAPADDCE